MIFDSDLFKFLIARSINPNCPLWLALEGKSVVELCLCVRERKICQQEININVYLWVFHFYLKE